jgi:phosphonate transport system permease protein
MEIIVRESAFFGILGVATLGYHVDAAVSELHFDVAVMLILATVGLCALIDMLSRRLRRALRLSTMATRLAGAPAG